MCDENERNKEENKRRALNNNFIDRIIDYRGRIDRLRRYQRNGWMNLSELQDIDSLHIEGTNTIVKGGLSWKGWIIEAWAHEWAPLNLHWLVLNNGGINLHNCWFVDSI